MNGRGGVPCCAQNYMKNHDANDKLIFAPVNLDSFHSLVSHIFELVALKHCAGSPKNATLRIG